MKKQVILSFIIGLLVGAIITAAIFLILKPGNGGKKRPSGNMPDMQNGERPSFKDGERPELPEGMDEESFKEKFKERSKDSGTNNKEE
jgi:gas vesicle protein